MDKRTNAFLILYNAGWTLEIIGANYDMSRQNVHLILSQSDKYNPQLKLDQRNEKIREVYTGEDYAHLKIVDIADMFNVGKSTISRVCEGLNRPSKVNLKTSQNT